MTQNPIPIQRGKSAANPMNDERWLRVFCTALAGMLANHETKTDYVGSAIEIADEAMVAIARREKERG
jgi:hypothetical protein